MQKERDLLTDEKYPILGIKSSAGNAEGWIKEQEGENEKKGGKPLLLQIYDKGYDIWLGNVRGAKNSHFNENFSENDESFDRWDFSWAE